MKRTLLPLVLLLCSPVALAQTQEPDSAAAATDAQSRHARWDINAEAAGGMGSHYLARLFALRATSRSQLWFFGSLNNVNEFAQPDARSEWQPAKSGTGIGAARLAGMGYQLTGGQGQFKLEGSAEFRHNDIVKGQYALGESFLEQGNIYAQTASRKRTHSYTFNTSHTFEFTGERTNLRIKPSVNYTKSSEQQASVRAMYSVAPEELESTLDSLQSTQISAEKKSKILNKQYTHKQETGHELTATLDVQTSFNLPGRTGVLLIEANGLCIDNMHRVYQHKKFCYPATGSGDKFQNRYEELPYKESSATAKVSLWKPLSGSWAVQPYYEYTRRHVKRNRVLTRLDRLNEWNEEDDTKFPSLPSFGDWHETAFDGNNSVYSTLRDNYHTAGLYLRKEQAAGNNWEWTINLPLRFEREGMDYCRPAMVDTSLVRRGVFFRPSVEGSTSWDVARRGGSGFAHHELALGYSLYTEAQPISFEISYRDDSNPQNILVTGNKLHDSWKSAFHATYKWSNLRSHQLTSTAKFNITQNALTMQSVYDRETGVLTVSPNNINGNWDASGELSYSLPVDPKKKVVLKLGTKVAYVHSVDYSGVTDNVARNVVGTANWSQTVRLDYKATSDLLLSLRATGAWLHANGSAECFTNIKASDFTCGLSVQTALMYKVQLSTGLTLYSRRGYTDHLMNGNDLVWNARLSRQFLKKRLSVAVEGFDLLGQMTQVRRTINAKGRTETMYNTLRQYVMLHVAYRFSSSPKHGK